MYSMRRTLWSPIPPGEQLICGIGDGYATRRDPGSSDYELLYTLSGHGRFSCAERSLACLASAGDLVLLRPGTTHDYAPERRSDWRWIWIHFQPRPSWLALLDWPEVAPGTCLLRLDDQVLAERVKGRLFETEALARGRGLRRNWLALNALEEVLLWCDVQHLGVNGRPMDARVRQVLDRLAQDFESPCRREELARLAGLSVPRLAVLFRHEVGIGITQHRDRLRLGRAARLLRATNDSVQRIATSVGYDNPFHFSVRFKAFAGMSPQAYRNQM